MVIHEIALTIGIICILGVLLLFMVQITVDTYYSSKYFHKQEQLIEEELDKLRYERENRK